MGLPSLDLLRQTAAAATKAAAAVRVELVAALAAAVRMHLPAALARPAQTDRRSATKAAVAPRPRQPPQCEWSGCTRRRSAAAVRMHLPAAPTAVRMEPAALPAAFAPQC